MDIDLENKGGAWFVAQLVECLPDMHEALVSVPSTM